MRETCGKLVKKRRIFLVFLLLKQRFYGIRRGSSSFIFIEKINGGKQTASAISMQISGLDGRRVARRPRKFIVRTLGGVLLKIGKKHSDDEHASGLVGDKKNKKQRVPPRALMQLLFICRDEINSRQ